MLSIKIINLLFIAIDIPVKNKENGINKVISPID